MLYADRLLPKQPAQFYNDGRCPARPSYLALARVELTETQFPCPRSHRPNVRKGFFSILLETSTNSRRLNKPDLLPRLGERLHQ